jgi:hypothetical protein
MVITDQVATAPCTDCVQARRPTLKAKPCSDNDQRFLVTTPPIKRVQSLT